MPGSMATDDLSVRNHLCPYNNCAICADRTPFQCPADLAICCIRDILTEISKLHSPEEQENKFSEILEKHLAELYGVDIKCFWALHDKPSEKEIKRAKSGKTEKPKPKCQVLNEAITLLNDEFNSVPFLERLIKFNIGSGHVFGIEMDRNGIVLRAYTGESLKGYDKKFYKYNLPWPNGKSVNSFIDSFNENTPLERAKKKVLDYCNSWRESAEKLKGKLLEDISDYSSIDNAKEISLNERELISSACSHFALIMLFAENNHFRHVSYILASTLQGESHSSMVVFWPFIDRGGFVGPHTRFLLHVVLGLNAIQERTISDMTRLIDSILCHDMNSLYNNLTSHISKLIKDIDKPKLSDDRKRKKLKNIQSLVNLSFYSTGLKYLWSGRDRDMLLKEIEPLSDLHKIFLKDMEFEHFSVKCSGDWNSTVYVPKALRIVLANLIRNARVPATNKEACVEVWHDEYQVVFRVKSEKPMSREWQEKAFKSPYTRTIPSKHRGLWICRTIIRHLDGKWDIEPREKKYNTRIFITIPRG